MQVMSGCAGEQCACEMRGHNSDDVTSCTFSCLFSVLVRKSTRLERISYGFFFLFKTGLSKTAFWAP